MQFFLFLGIHAIAKAGNRINYNIYNLSSGKLVQECPLPTDAAAFMGIDSSLISLTIAGEVSFFLFRMRSIGALD